MPQLKPLANIRKLPRTLFGFYRKRRSTQTYTNSLPLILADLEDSIIKNNESLKIKYLSEIKHALMCAIYLEHRSSRNSSYQEIIKAGWDVYNNQSKLPEDIWYEISFFLSVPNCLETFARTYYYYASDTTFLTHCFPKILSNVLKLAAPMLKKLNVPLGKFCSDIVHFYMQHHSSFWRANPTDLTPMAQFGALPFAEQMPVLSDLLLHLKDATPESLELIQDWFGSLNITNVAIAEEFLKTSIKTNLNFDQVTGFYIPQDISLKLKNTPIIQSEIDKIAKKLENRDLLQFSMFCLGSEYYRQNSYFYSYFLSRYLENKPTKTSNRLSSFCGEISQMLLDTLAANGQQVIDILQSLDDLNKSKVAALGKSPEFKRMIYELLEADMFYTKLSEQIISLKTLCGTNIKNFLVIYKEDIENHPALFSLTLEVTDPFISLAKVVSTDKFLEVKNTLKFNGAKEDLSMFLGYLKMGPGHEISAISQAVLIYIFSAVIIQLQAALSHNRNAFLVEKKDLSF